MFRIYHSNRLDLLKDLIAYHIEREPLTDPFASEVILVQSHGMAQWLQIQLAEHFRIAANIQFPLPASFIWQMFTTLLPGIPKESAFSKDAMTWKLMHLLPKMLSHGEFAALNYYLQDDEDKRKHYQLASRIADIFDHYLVYRPEWLQTWEREELVVKLDETQVWQAALWRALNAYTASLAQPLWHRANLYQRFIEALQSKEQDFSQLPKRVFICGISALPPVYIQTLQALGQHVDIHLMFTNPCRFYWGDVQDYAFIAQLNARYRLKQNRAEKIALFKNSDQIDALFNQRGEQQLTNPLLASWGKQGRDNIFLLAQLENIQEIDAFVEIPADNLLHRLQRDILELEDHSQIGNNLATLLTSENKYLLDEMDSSVEIHVCHSAQREVEVLHDKILTLLDNNPRLNPRDIIVMVADIDSYAPYIQAVFANAPKDRYLPFAISDRKAKDVHPIIQVFLTLLDLPQSRFNAEDILALLDIPALAAAFGIDEGGLKVLRQWVNESGIRWGLDDDMQGELSLPVTGKNTWHFGMTRMLLGYAMNSESGSWQGVLPYDESSGLIAELAGMLADLLAQLTYWRQKLQQELFLEAWLIVCRDLLDAFFIVDNETEPVLALIEQQWQQIISYGLSAKYTSAIPVTILRDELTLRLDNERVSQRFLAGPINFCTLMPMRSIPFDVVCLLGMNDGVYPRTIAPLGFDLMSQQPQKGDRSRRDDDRYLFFEALLSAQQQFYISYIGRSLQDNSLRYPSVLVTELLEYISQSHTLMHDRLQDIDTSAKGVLQHLVKNHAKAPFSPQNFIPYCGEQSYAKEWLPTAQFKEATEPLFTAILSPLVIQQLSIDELRRFYRHPIRAFFQQRLRVYFSQEVNEIINEEPFELYGLTRYRINVDLLNLLIAKGDPQQLFQRLKSAGELPFGAFAELAWQQQLELIQPIADKVIAEKQSVEIEEFSIKIHDVTLFGRLHQMQPEGVLRWRAAELSIIDGLVLWIDHLVYCYLGGLGESRMYGRKESEWRFVALDKQQAGNELLTLIEGYKKGMMSPLLLLPKSGWEWLNCCYDKQTRQIDWSDGKQNRAQQLLLSSWQGEKFKQGEADDPYIQRLLVTLNRSDIEEIMKVTQEYFIPMVNCRQT